MSDRQKHPLLTLFLLTIVAGVLRFSAIDKPAIWGDEAATWRRICGSYQQMIDELRVAGFMPGNYVLTWWIKEGFPVWGEFREGQPPNDRGIGRTIKIDRSVPLSAQRVKWLNFTPTIRLVENGLDASPLVMRFLPALCGTIMVPAMYFLASRLVARKTALLAAIFTCCSAYMLNYSRDAKMYMQFWCFATLHVGCLLWWLEAYRPREKKPAPEHIANDSIVGGVHQILPDQHINRIGDAFISKPAERRKIESGYPCRLETAVRWMAWLTTGLAMVAFNAIGLGIVGIEVLIFLATVPLRSAWIGTLAQAIRDRIRRKETNEARKETNEAVATSPPPLASSRTQIAQRDRTNAQTTREPFRFFIPPIFGFILGCLAVVALWYSYKDFTRFYERVNPSDEIARMDLGDAGISWVEPYNRDRTVGSYFLYNATAYLMNWEWVKPDQLEDVDPRALKYLRWTSMSLLIAIGAGIVPWRKLISKKPADTSDLRGRSPMTSAFLVGCWLLLPAYGFYCASGAWTPGGSRERAFAPTQLVLSWIFPGAKGDNTQSLAGSLGAELSNAKRAKGWSSYDWGQLFVVHNDNWSNVRWIAIACVIAALLLISLDRWHRLPEKLRGGLRALLLLALFWVMAMAVYVFTPPQGGSIWMPRYLGFIWPAFAITACVLIRRLPLAPVRGLVILGVIGANLTVFYHRVNDGEPRTDLIAKDYRVARDSDKVRMFSRTTGGFMRGAPGFGSMQSMPAVYYVSRATNMPMSPGNAIDMMRRNLDLDPLSFDIANSIRVRLSRDEQCDEFYFWTEKEIGTEGRDIEKWIGETLDASWSPAEPAKQWTIYDHWTWRKIYQLERHHWKRSATTQPSTKPGR